MKSQINERARNACSSDIGGFLDALTTKLAALDRFWMDFYGDPFDWLGGRKIIRGTQNEWPVDAHYESLSLIHI